MTPDNTSQCEHCGEEYDEQLGERCPNATSPNIGGCWICSHGNGYEDEDMAFDIEFDTFYHSSCLPNTIESIFEYEQSRNTETKQ